MLVICMTLHIESRETDKWPQCENKSRLWSAFCGAATARLRRPVGFASATDSLSLADGSRGPELFNWLFSGPCLEASSHHQRAFLSPAAAVAEPVRHGPKTPNVWTHCQKTFLSTASLMIIWVLYLLFAFKSLVIFSCLVSARFLRVSRTFLSHYYSRTPSVGFAACKFNDAASTVTGETPI